MTVDIEASRAIYARSKSKSADHETFRDWMLYATATLPVAIDELERLRESQRAYLAAHDARVEAEREYRRRLGGRFGKAAALEALEAAMAAETSARDAMRGDAPIVVEDRAALKARAVSGVHAMKIGDVRDLEQFLRCAADAIRDGKAVAREWEQSNDWNGKNDFVEIAGNGFEIRAWQRAPVSPLKSCRPTGYCAERGRPPAEPTDAGDGYVAKELQRQFDEAIKQRDATRTELAAVRRERDEAVQDLTIARGAKQYSRDLLDKVRAILGAEALEGIEPAARRFATERDDVQGKARSLERDLEAAKLQLKLTQRDLARARTIPVTAANEVVAGTVIGNAISIDRHAVIIRCEVNGIARQVSATYELVPAALRVVGSHVHVSIAKPNGNDPPTVLGVTARDDA